MIATHFTDSGLVTLETGRGGTWDRIDVFCHTKYDICMTMFSFRVEDQEAIETQRWADRLGVDRSELLREALHRHLVRLRAEIDTEAWTIDPLSEDEKAFARVADWGPAEDWSDWADAAR